MFNIHDCHCKLSSEFSLLMFFFFEFFMFVNWFLFVSAMFRNMNMNMNDLKKKNPQAFRCSVTGQPHCFSFHGSIKKTENMYIYGNLGLFSCDSIGNVCCSVFGPLHQASRHRVSFSSQGEKVNLRHKRGEVLWTEVNGDGGEDGEVVYSGSVTLHHGRRGLPPPGYDSLSGGGGRGGERSMYGAGGDQLAFEEAVFATAREGGTVTVDRPGGHRSRAGRVGKVHGLASLFFFYPVLHSPNEYNLKIQSQFGIKFSEFLCLYLRCFLNTQTLYGTLCCGHICPLL